MAQGWPDPPDSSIPPPEWFSAAHGQLQMRAPAAPAGLAATPLQTRAQAATSVGSSSKRLPAPPLRGLPRNVSIRTRSSSSPSSFDWRRRTDVHTDLGYWFPRDNRQLCFFSPLRHPSRKEPINRHCSNFE